MATMKLVIVESPFNPTVLPKPRWFDPILKVCGFDRLKRAYRRGVERNLAYLRECMRDCLLRGEAPFASHALYTQPGVLDDTVPAEREHGIHAGFAWAEMAGKRVVYVDLGSSKGMLYGIDHAKKLGQPIEYRSIRQENLP